MTAVSLLDILNGLFSDMLVIPRYKIFQMQAVRFQTSLLTQIFYDCNLKVRHSEWGIPIYGPGHVLKLCLTVFPNTLKY
jgi:hypothetical protein